MFVLFLLKISKEFSSVIENKSWRVFDITLKKHIG